MNLLIYSYEDDSCFVMKDVEEYFSGQFPEKEIAWEHKGAALSATLSISEPEIISVFEELIRRYPKLHVEASFSYDVREEDRSARWWGVTKVYSEKKNGETKIVSSSNTYWN